MRTDQTIINSVPNPTAILAAAVDSGTAKANSTTTQYIAEPNEIFFSMIQPSLS